MDQHPLAPLERLASQIRQVKRESVSLLNAVGRVLAGPVTADRDSPPSDVSAMDGYGLRMDDAKSGQTLRVVGESVPGKAPVQIPERGEALRIFTGATVPPECELVIRREDVDETAAEASGTVRIHDSDVRLGLNIRRRGENTKAGETILDAGTRIHAGHIAAAANFGAVRLEVTAQVNIAILVTGNELLSTDSEVQPWQLRDSNGPTLLSLLRSPNHLCTCQRVEDSLPALTAAVSHAMSNADAVVLTGGVSMGDYDFVPRACELAGATTAFHKLPIRPGKPLYGAVGNAGQMILGLPGNPVSAAVGAARFARPLLAYMAKDRSEQAQSICTPSKHLVELLEPGDKTLPLLWFRLVREVGNNQVESVRSRGSGDLVSLAQSDGFIEVPPEQSGAGPWPYTRW